MQPVVICNPLAGSIFLCRLGMSMRRQATLRPLGRQRDRSLPVERPRSFSALQIIFIH